MIHPLRRALGAYAHDAREAAVRAPVEVVLGLLLAASWSVQLHDSRMNDEDWARIASAIVLAFPLVFAASVLRARGVLGAGARWAVTAAVLAMAAGFYAWFDPDLGSHAWRWGMGAVAVVLLLLLTPALPWGARDRRGTWAFCWRVVERLVGVSLYSAALYGILAGAFAAVVTLFDLERPEHLYGDLAAVVFFALAPWIFVGGTDRLIAPAPGGGVPVGVSRLGRWLYAPVLVIYLAILYAYAAKVLATGELPENLVSPLVIAAGLIAFIGGVLLQPVHGDDEHRGVALLARWSPALLLPLLPLAFWTLAVRLDQYGWTEFRYVRIAILVALAVLAVAGTVRAVRGRPPLLSLVPAVLAGVLLVSAIGPWSASDVSRRDQTRRLRGAFHEARLDPARPPTDTMTVDSAMFEAIDGGMRYLLETHGRGALRAVIPTVPDTLQARWRMAYAIGLRRGCTTTRARASSDLGWAEGVGGLLGGTMTSVKVEDGQRRRQTPANPAVRLALAGDTLRAEGDGWRAAAGVEAFRELLRAQVSQGCDPAWMAGGAVPTLPARLARVDLRDAAGSVRAQMIVTRATVGGPLEVEPEPQTPGIAVRELDGYLIVPR